MRWNEALEQASAPQQPEVPKTITHRSGSYQDVYSDRFFIYPVGITAAIRTARTSVVEHVLNEFDLNDNGWYTPALFQKKHRTWFAWFRWVLQRLNNGGSSAKEEQP